MNEIDLLNYVDPDDNYLNENSSQTCNYYSNSNDLKNYLSSDMSKSLLFLNHNIRSFSANIDGFMSTMSYFDLNVAVLGFTETWFTSEFSKPIVGYNATHTIRAGGRRSGGVSIYIRDDLYFEEIPTLSFQDDSIEICSIKIKIGPVYWIYMCIYRPHGESIESFTNSLERILNTPIIQNKNIILAGDFNLNLLKCDSSHEIFINLMRSMHFLPKISKPTRFSPIEGINPSLLDHIWINSISDFNVGILASDLTDHCPTFITIPLNTNVSQNEKRKVTFRLHSDENFERFASALEDFDWDSLLSGDLDSDVSSFVEKLNSLYRKHFPIKIKYISNKKNQNRWMTPEIIKLIKYKNLMFELYKNGLVPIETNKLCKNKVQKIIKKSKDNYFLNAFERCKSNMRETWNLIRSLSGAQLRKGEILSLLLEDGSETNDRTKIAETFNSYFNSVANSLLNNLTPSNIDPLSYVTRNERSLFLRPVYTNEISNIILNLESKKGSHNSCPDHLLKRIHYFIAPILCKLVNLSFQIGKFPECLKHATIVPIYKSGNRNTVSNYRPISILSTFSKIFEKTMLNRLWSFLYKFQIISEHQYGFMKGRSTEDAVNDLTELFYDKLNSRHFSIAVFIDFQKAFDTVDNRILIAKMEKYGVRGAALDWFESYLQNRKHSVKIGEFVSNSKTLNIGIPQGSQIAPVLFLLFINDLPKFSTNAQSFLFADDSTLCFSGPNLSDLINNCNTELDKFTSWTSANKLSINLNKTNYMIITNRPYENEQLNPVFINAFPIEKKQCVKFLGVMLDNKLNFRDHIQYICNKISKNSGVLRNMSSSVPTKILNNLYYSLIHPYLNYCTTTWGGTFDSVLEPLRLAQKRAIRIVNKKPYLSHTMPLFLVSKILRLDELYKHRVLCYFFIKDHSIYQRNHSYNSRYGNLLLPNFQRLAVTQNSLSFIGPTFWNALPDRLKLLNTLPRFKSELRVCLLSTYEASD